MPDRTCEICGGSGLIWHITTLDRWHSQHTGLPPDQWRDLRCRCAADEPPLKRTKRART